ncbi:DUF1905 domain-containing protein [Flavobacterium eburneipallidum]|uniref:DUF1905 domain-containing protein n=1 Tax=Flavobacterium eburneipallidum TaxID=3003263 RepID=UPI002482E293|nr:DUF1905 domain-containing protein [Flavobacterium eburneipallidum]
MNGKIKYEFTATVWQHSAPGGWYFVSLPEEMAKEIRNLLQSEEEGWGRLKATAQIDSTNWQTAIWFDSKKETYLLPLKAEIRKKETIEAQKTINVVLWL